MPAQRFYYFVFALISGLLLCSCAYGSPNESPTVLFFGPKIDNVNISLINSNGPNPPAANLYGENLSGQFQFSPSYFAVLSLNSVQGNILSPAHVYVPWSDFETAVGVGHSFHIKWFNNWHEAVVLTYTRGNRPFGGVDPAGQPALETAKLTKLALQLTGSFDLTDRLTSLIGLGFLYGQMHSSDIYGSPPVNGGLLRFQLTYQFSSKFFALGEAGAERERYSYSVRNQSAVTSTINSFNLLIVSAKAGIGYVF